MARACCRFDRAERETEPNLDHNVEHGHRTGRASKSDNVRDHRAGTSDLPFQKHAQVRLRVHHIVILRPRFCP